jgi:hypothetical protein
MAIFSFHAKKYSLMRRLSFYKERSIKQRKGIPYYKPPHGASVIEKEATPKKKQQLTNLRTVHAYGVMSAGPPHRSMNK